MKRILIIGAGGFGREVLSWARDTFDDASFGFLDDDSGVKKDGRLRAPLVAPIKSYEPIPGDHFLCALGKPQLRRFTSELIENRGGSFIKLCHPAAIIAEGAELGDGSIVCPFALVSADTRVGKGTAIYYHSSVDHDVTVGNWSQISAHCDLGGEVEIGESVFVGSHASILPGVRLGNEVVVGAGAVVTKSYTDGVLAGVPARPLERKSRD